MFTVTPAVLVITGFTVSPVFFVVSTGFSSVALLGSSSVFGSNGLGVLFDNTAMYSARVTG